MAELITINGNHLISLDCKETYLTLVITGDTSLQYNLSNGNYHFLVVNKGKNDLSLVENCLLENASATFTYIDINNINVNQVSKYILHKNCNLSTYYYGLVQSNKDVKMLAINQEGNSSSLMDNSVVCLEDSIFKMDVIGQIIKGSKEAKAYQRSRCLTIGKPKKSTISPILKIDENDVEAGHALATGAVDDSVMYYMNARGLNKKEALSLLIKAYLLPIIDNYKDYKNANEIFADLEKQVEKVCLM